MSLIPFMIAGGEDEYFANVSLLLHMDGTNGSTTFIDHSLNSFSLTANGNAQISTAQSKFGGASGLFDGSGDSVTLADNAAFHFGTGDFTVEFWARVTSNPSSGSKRNIVAFSTSAITDGWCVLFGDNGGGSQYIGISTNSDLHYTVAGKPTLNTWEHYAFVRNGTAISIYKDGVSQTLNGGGTSSGNLDTTATFNIGGDIAGNIQQDYAGYIDDLRITKGVARYTVNFTAPTTAFPNG